MSITQLRKGSTMGGGGCCAQVLLVIVSSAETVPNWKGEEEWLSDTVKERTAGTSWSLVEPTFGPEVEKICWSVKAEKLRFGLLTQEVAIRFNWCYGDIATKRKKKCFNQNLLIELLYQTAAGVTRGFRSDWLVEGEQKNEEAATFFKRFNIDGINRE